MNRKWLAVAQALITAVLLATLFNDFDWIAFRALYARLPFGFYVLSLAVVLAGLVLYAWRWRTLLLATGARVSFGVVLRQYFIGVFMNNFFPSTIGGDAAKVFYLGRIHGYSSVGTSVALDRLLGLGLLAVLAAVAQWIERVDTPQHVAARWTLTCIALGFAAAIALAQFGTGGLPEWLAPFGSRAVALAGTLQRFRIALARAIASPRVWMYSIGTVAAYFFMLTLLYQEFITLQTGVRPGFLPVLTAISSVAVLSNLPIAINGIGLREHLHVMMLAPLAAGDEVSVGISLLLFVHLLVASLIGCVAWWRPAPGAQAPELR